MADNKSQYDELKCGNCGYDGGKAHLNEKLEWQQKLSKAVELSDSTIQNRHWVLGITLMVCALFGSVTYGLTKDKAVQPVNSIIGKMNVLESMYAKCMAHGNYAKSEHKAAVVKECNETFGNEMVKMNVDNVIAVSADAGVVQ